MKLLNNQSAKIFLVFTIIGILIGLMIGGLIWILVNQPSGSPVLLSTRAENIQITIYISGKVVSPGVYQLPVNSRIVDAINAAGGTLPSADIDHVNLAKFLSDSEHIYVPSIPMVGELVVSKININQATQAQLETLPGIGPSVAKSIMEYRTEFGQFSEIEEIQKVPGIGPATFEEIKDYITVGG